MTDDWPDEQHPDDGLLPMSDDDGRATTAPSGRRRARRRVSGCLPLLVVLVVVAVLAVVLVPRGIDSVKSRFGSPDDFAGPGQGDVCFVVAPGDSLTTTGDQLEAQGVVASAQAFTDAADGRSIRDGSYQLRQQMKASDVVDAMTSGARKGTGSSCLTNLTILPGHTEADTMQLLAKATDFSVKQLTQAAQETTKLGLPSYAGGEAEGYLAPGQYVVHRGDTPLSLLQQMVQQFETTATQVDLVAGAKKLGYTPGQVVIVASLIQKEVGKPADMAKVARVIYNRLEHPGTAGTAGFLQLDSTINYAIGRGGFDLSPADLGVDSPYNTRTHQGLPPGPIDSPGVDALTAALNPTPGDWYYYVTTNPDTQKTKFATSFEEFQRYEAEFQQFCQTSKVC
jgi:UPF0755 protein